MSDIGKALGTPVAFRLGDNVMDVYPVRLKDWPTFMPVLFVLDLENLHELHFFGEGPVALLDMLRIVLRREDIPEFIDEMTQTEYHRLRGLIMQQNEIDLERLQDKISKLTRVGNEEKKE